MVMSCRPASTIPRIARSTVCIFAGVPSTDAVQPGKALSETTSRPRHDIFASSAINRGCRSGRSLVESRALSTPTDRDSRSRTLSRPLEPANSSACPIAERSLSDGISDAVHPEDPGVPPAQAKRGLGRAGKEAGHGFDAVPVAEVEQHVIVTVVHALRIRLAFQKACDIGGSSHQARQ